jgi:hypothetical protein
MSSEGDKETIAALRREIADLQRQLRVEQTARRAVMVRSSELKRLRAMEVEMHHAAQQRGKVSGLAEDALLEGWIVPGSGL